MIETSSLELYGTINIPAGANLEEKSVTIEETTTVVTPSSGYDGMSKVTIDASEIEGYQLEVTSTTLAFTKGASIEGSELIL